MDLAPFVLSAGLGGSFQRGERVSKLEVGVSHIGLFGQEFLQGNDGRLEIILIHVRLRFIQQIVERILKFLGLGGGRLLGKAGSGEQEKEREELPHEEEV